MWFERLAEHGVGGVLQVVKVDRPGDERHGDPRSTQPTEQVARVALLEVDVEEDDVGPFLHHGTVGLGDRCRLAHCEAVELEIHPAEQAQRHVVVDDEHPGRTSIHRRRMVTVGSARGAEDRHR